MTPFFIGTVLNLASLYMIAGVGCGILKRCGEYNLGGEGQIYFSGFFCAILLQHFQNFPPFLAVSLCLIICFILTSLITLFSAFLKDKFNADFLFTSFIISSAIIPLINGLITGKFRGTTGNLLATEFIKESFRFTQILPPSKLNISFFAIILIPIIAGLFLFRTKLGREICLCGVSKEFALYAGINQKKTFYIASLLSGGFHGICGVIAICGTYYTCHLGFHASLGWNALSACLIAFANPFLIIPSSIFLALIITSANNFALYNNFNFDMSGIIQAVIMFVISFSIFQNNFSRKKK